MNTPFIYVYIYIYIYIERERERDRGGRVANKTIHYSTLNDLFVATEFHVIQSGSLNWVLLWELILQK